MKSSLKNLDTKKLRDLGGALGLSYPNLKRMNAILDDMTAAWLNKEDNVLEKSGEPTWNRLVKALEKIGQKGVADGIKNEKSCSDTGNKSSTKSKKRFPLSDHGEVAPNTASESSQLSSEENEGSTSKTVACRVVCCKYLKYAISLVLVATLICSMLYICWPKIMYSFNLLHSKSLPYLSRNFVGREKEMKEVSQLLDFKNSDIRIVNIYGSPGFGKSTLAIHVGHQIMKDGVTVHYVNMDDFPDKDIKTALAEKILEASQIVSKNITFERLLRWARERSSKTLVILDNCDDVIHKKKDEFHLTVVKMVEESLNVKVTLTSRKVAAFLMYCQYYKIEELSITASCQLLEHKIPLSISLSSKEKEQIANLTGNVPLALQIIGSLLHLPDSPSPTVLIDELKNELIKTLSPEDFPAHEQVFTTIGLSYKYLPKELQQIGRQLTVFPGSFELPAAFAVCNSSVESTISKEFGGQLKSLVRNSLLEHSQRTDRYQYHRLIKEYFLHVQRRDWPNEAAKFLPAFHIYYATELKSESGFKYQYEQSLAFLDYEQHNLEHLFENLKHMQSTSNKKLDITEFVTTVMALSSAVDANFLQVRFSMEKCCMLLNSTLNKLDRMMPHLQYYLHCQPFEVESVLDSYLIIIKLMATCEKKYRGVWEAMLVYSVRKTIIESKSDVMGSLKYINFYKELSSFYLQLGEQFEVDVLECHRLIIKRTDTYLATCQPKQCKYYDFGIIYHAMGQYQGASEFFEEEIKRSVDVMSQVRALVKLVYIYSYMDKYDKMISTTARLQNLYSDVAALPPDQLVDASDAILMFIEFYRAGELFDEVYSLENRFIDGLLNLKNKVRTAFHNKQPAEHQASLLGRACKALDDFFEAGNYTKTIEVGNFLIKLIGNSDSFDNAKINLLLLVGKAKFHVGQYSDGMDYIELALLSTPNNMKKIREACWYLIPRMTYLDICYQIKQNLMMAVAMSVVSFVRSVPFLILSPFPFYSYDIITISLFDLGKNIDNKGEKQILTLQQLSHSTTLVTTTGSLEIVDRYNKWFVLIQPQLNEALSGVRATFRLLELFFIKFVRVCYFTVCVLYVWVKLICAYIIYIKIRWFQQPAKSKLADYYASHYVFYVVIVRVFFSVLIDCKSFIHATVTVRIVCDPRFRYGADETPHAKFLDSF